MATTPPRALAAQVLTSVLQDGVHLSAALRQRVPSMPSARDAALVQEFCYGTLRFRPRLEFWLSRLLQQPLKARDCDIHVLLLMGFYQLAEMRVPTHAAVQETAEACRYLRKEWAVKLVNAVLRRFQREQVRLQAGLSGNEEALYAHPRWLMQRIRADWPQDWQAILHANNSRPPFSLRVNRRATTRADVLGEFTAAGMLARPGDFAADAIVLAQPLNVEMLPGFAAGKFSVQDEAAQLAAELLGVEAGMRVLDACAAPGGKTCHLLECCPDAGEVLAIDSDAARTGKIHENLRRLGLLARVIVADATRPDTWWDGRPFERILLDAPCSASGVIRRHPDIKSHRNSQQVSAAVTLQARLLAALWPLLARGGKLLYATCSVFSAENARQMEAFLTQHVKARPAEICAAWGVGAGPGRQILTGAGGMDGFYYACMEKI
ncbi:MAG: 16S rRNA (cytosine(967)-C(5))-methyltransferase RsmB [Gammaproteobacteria bacterium]